MTRFEPDWLLFASDAAVLAGVGALLLALAVIAAVMDRRRHNRDRLDAPDRVGWMPWTLVSLVSGVAAAGLLAVSLPGLIGGQG